MQVLNTTAIISGYAGCDPQRGNSDGSFLVSSLLSYKKWLKVLLCSLKRKEKKAMLICEESGILRRRRK